MCEIRAPSHVKIKRFSIVILSKKKKKKKVTDFDGVGDPKLGPDTLFRKSLQGFETNVTFAGLGVSDTLTVVEGKLNSEMAETF